jgi:ABC-type uncharacterized transport system substrate-binding protein
LRTLSTSGPTLVTRYADVDVARLPALADELVQLHPDLIVAIDPPAALAAAKATASVPIVAAILNDPVRLGLIASYARPGGNVTGILSQVEGLPGKHVEIARELLPTIAVIGVLVNPANATHSAEASFRLEFVRPERGFCPGRVRRVFWQARTSRDQQFGHPSLLK